MLPGLRAVEREQMRGGQVLDVDVVADRGAVGRVVVGPVDVDVLGLAAGGAQDVRDQMRLGSWSSPTSPLAPATLKYRRLTAPSPCAWQKVPIMPSTASLEAP